MHFAGFLWVTPSTLLLASSEEARRTLRLGALRRSSPDWSPQVPEQSFLPLAFDDEIFSGGRHVQVFLVDTRNIGLDDYLFGCFSEVDVGTPTALPFRAEERIEKAVYFSAELGRLPHRVLFAKVRTTDAFFFIM